MQVPEGQQFWFDYMQYAPSENVPLDNANIFIYATDSDITYGAKLLPSKQLHPGSLVGKQLAGPEGHTTASAFGLVQTPNRSKDLEMNDMFGMSSEGTAEAPLAPIVPTRFRPLAPTTPTIYHGDEDPMKFFKYVSQCKRFTREAQLPLTDQVACCGDYL